MNQAERLNEEQEEIDEICKSLREAGVVNMNPDDEVNIDMAEHEGWPPKHI